jgi:hypothetical protein
MISGDEMIGRTLSRRLERLEQLAMPSAIQHVITVTYVSADGTQTGGGYRIKGPSPNGDWRKQRSAIAVNPSTTK